MRRNRTTGKLRRLGSILRQYPGAVIAFSGGVDSTLLLHQCRAVLGDRIIAVTFDAPHISRADLAAARRAARSSGVRHLVVHPRGLGRQFRKNSARRCYYCKRAMMRRLSAIARDNAYVAVEGSNASDRLENRPGARAGHEFGVRSPLAQAGLTKTEVRTAARALKIASWDRPANACLATRIPAGTPLRPSALRRVERAENALGTWVGGITRVRDLFPVACVEVQPPGMVGVVKHRAAIVRALKRVGYRTVVLDLVGYRRPIRRRR